MRGRTAHVRCLRGNISNVRELVELKAPSTIALAWLVAPASVVAISAGLGCGLSRLSGVRLGVLTVPAGFLGGIAIGTFALEVGAHGRATAALTALAGAGGAVSWAIPCRDQLRLRTSTILDRLWPIGAAVVTFLGGLALVAGSGRIGISGYVFNNDPAVHLSAIELLIEHGAHGLNVGASSFDSVGSLFSSGYPLGSYSWPVTATVLTGSQPFAIWTPLTAVSAAMTALIVYWFIRDLSAPAPIAAVAGATIASGYLPYSYLAQGGDKEVATATAVYGAVALFMHGAQGGLSWRRLLPCSVAAAAAIGLLGLGALAWLGPAFLIATGVMLWKPDTVGRGRSTVALTMVTVTVIAAVVAAPSIVSSVHYLSSSDSLLSNPAQVGNLLGPVPLSEAFNVWLAHDYRFPRAQVESLTVIAILLAMGLAVLGFFSTVRARRMAIVLAVLVAIAGAGIVSSRYAIYFEAKSFMVLAPGFGMCTAAGLLWLWRSGIAQRYVVLALTAALVAGVAASDAMVYAGSWSTPRDRFQELLDIDGKFKGQGPTLVNEREEYSKYLLRDLAPWESWGSWQPDRGLVSPTVPPVPITPDFDFYMPRFMKRFNLLVERRRPGGSRPPGNFREVYRTKHYRVWQRVGRDPRAHLALGVTGLMGSTSRAALEGADSFDCRSAVVRDLFRDARRLVLPLRVAEQREKLFLSRPEVWLEFAQWLPGPVRNFVVWENGLALAHPRLRPGKYEVWAQGAFGPGLRVSVGERRVGEAYDDLGLIDAWHDLGEAKVGARQPDFVLSALKRPLWRAGSRKYNIIGPLAFVPIGRNAKRQSTKVLDVPASRARELCGRKLDWVELP